MTEPECVAALLPAAQLPPAQKERAQALAAALVHSLRARPQDALAAMLGAYPLGSAEGQALMGLAEALLRIPDAATREDLLRDKLRGRNWHKHRALRMAALAAASPAWRFAAPLVRRAAERAIGAMAGNFVLGETMDEALARAAPLEAQGFRYTYDMLGEAAVSDADAQDFHAAYEQAIGAVRPAGDVHESAGISVKLSALHPRYCRAQRELVREELYPRLLHLAHLAKARGIGLTIDAEESVRLDLSLDLLERLCAEESLQGWNGLGLAVQAYHKRAPHVLDFCAGLARRSKRRLMLRLVKGAYWDHEIKQAQSAGFEDFPVFTRKIHTDISYLACARKMLEAPAELYPQFATHNALTIASIHAMAGGAEYEFQCLHGMGEDLYAEAAKHTGRRCRIYAPVGAHGRLLAYLSRRLLENGANGSFVNQLRNKTIPAAQLLRDPADEARHVSPPGAPHHDIALPAKLFGPRRLNASGLDLADEPTLASLAAMLARDIRWPQIIAATPASIDAAFSAAACYTPPLPKARHELLLRAGEALERHRIPLLRLLIEEGRKPIPAALAEIREAVDYCRYYGAQIANWPAQTHVPLGTVICISPWNFPLAIFLGQAVAAFAAGNAVLAKPAEQTPAIAAYAVKLLHESGIPGPALQLIQGDGAVGAMLTGDPRAQGVVFTGGLAAARSIQNSIAGRLTPEGRTIPFIAETGGQNAMIADSSALPEQLIADVLVSAFDCAGQRCSALRLLCLQKELAPLVLPRLRAALADFCSGSPAKLASDAGPLIDTAAAEKIRAHIETLRAAGCAISQSAVPESGDFVPATIAELPDLTLLRDEIFGPVLHVITWRRGTLPALLRRINALGYGLTFGVHSRIEQRAMALARASTAGNIYVNRNMIGAVVGSQPFGGAGLSGTGPKAGGPLYLHRLLARGPAVLPCDTVLPGPVGERNLYSATPGRLVYCRAKTAGGRAAQQEALRAANARAGARLDDNIGAVLLEDDAAGIAAFSTALAARPGPVVPLHALTPAAVAAGAGYNPGWLAHERVISINTAAAGGDAALIAAT